MVSYCFLSQAKIEKKRFPLKWKLRKTTSSKHTRDVRFLWFPVSSLWRIFKNKSIAPPTILHTHMTTWYVLCTMCSYFLNFYLRTLKRYFLNLQSLNYDARKHLKICFLWNDRIFKTQMLIQNNFDSILHWPIFNEFSSTYFWLIWNMMLFHDSINKSMHAWRLFRNVLTQLNWNMYLDFAKWQTNMLHNMYIF